MQAHDPLGDAQPDATAPGLGRIKGSEDRGQSFRRNAGAIVRDCYIQPVAPPLRLYGDGAIRLPLDRLSGVANQVD